MHTVDDYEAIRLRMEELRRERREAYRDKPVEERPMCEPDGIAHVPRTIVRRYLADPRRSSAR